MNALHSPVQALSAAGGQALRAATRVVALRPAAKPLHPHGTVSTARLVRFGGAALSGAAFLDGQGVDEVLVRESRAIGLPAPAPDVFGLALRVPRRDGGYGDLLLASTGLGRLTRFTLTAGRRPGSRPMTTLLPYRSPSGPVLVGARYRGDGFVELAWAHLAGGWQPFAELRPERAPAGHEEPVSFDPVRNTLPGLENYAWVRTLREPSYRTARGSRSAPA